MQTLADHSVQHLPLGVNEASWDGDTLSLKGNDWSFSTQSAWRIVDKESIIAACWDKHVSGYVNELGKLEILTIETQGQTLAIDPLFGFSNHTWLEVFSTEVADPWVLSLPNGKIFIGNT